MTHADKKMNTLHFWSDPAGIRIRIRINPEIRNRIQDQIMAWAEFALSECSCLCFVFSSSFFWLNLVVITSTIDCLEILVT